MDILSRIVSYDEFKISLDTNLTTGGVDRFMRIMPPDKVEYIFASMHPEERERIFGSIVPFVDDVLTLMKNGYNIAVSYVMAPSVYGRFKDDYEYCMSRGIEPALRQFRGVYNGKRYPDSYTTEELQEIFLKYSPAYNRDRVGSRSFTGRKCNAGGSLIRIRGNGDVTPCLCDHTSMGNIFTGFKLYESPIVCRHAFCRSWSMDRLFDDPTGDVEVDPPPPFPLWERWKLSMSQLRAWWQVD